MAVRSIDFWDCAFVRGDFSHVGDNGLNVGVDVTWVACVFSCKINPKFEGIILGRTVYGKRVRSLLAPAMLPRWGTYFSSTAWARASSNDFWIWLLSLSYILCFCPFLQVLVHFLHIFWNCVYILNTFHKPFSYTFKCCLIHVQYILVYSIDFLYI